MKTLALNTSIKTLMSVLIAAMIMMSCSKNDDLVNPEYTQANDGDTKSLTIAEQNDLLYMIEKEKMMRNIYKTMFQEYNVELFQSIYQAKESHLSLLSSKIDKYDVHNPLVYSAENEFENSSLQLVYDDFLAKKLIYEIEALNFVKNMEERHINYVETTVSQVDGNDDIVSVYNVILLGSQAHLDALLGFASGYTDLIKPYDPYKEM